MSAGRELFFMVALLSFVLGTSIRELRENLSQQAECLGACNLARDERSKTTVKVLSVLSCYHCLNKRKGKQWRQERIKGPLSFTAKTFTKRHRRSIFLDPSLPTSSTALKPSDCVGSSEDISVPELLIPSKVDVAFGQYENTRYWYVNVSWTPVNDFSGHLNGTLLVLALPDSEKAMNCTVLRKNQTFLNINISFYGYIYPEHIYLSILGLPYRKGLGPMESYYPSKPTSSSLSTSTHTTGIPTSSTLSETTASASGGLDSSSPSTTPATTSFDTSPNHTVKYVSIATVSGLLVGLVLVLGFLKCMFLYMRPKGSVPVPSGFDYHAFIIYSSEDSDWVQNRLLHTLEKKYHLKCCIHYRDFPPAVPFCENMAESVHKSFKIIAVYSKNFLESPYCNHELELAEYRQTTQRDNCLVIIRIDETGCDRLPQGLRGRSVIDYSAKVERLFWMDRLLQFLGVPEESDNQNIVTGKGRKTNTRRDSRGRRIRNTFVRLNSTSSHESEVSVL